MLLPAFDLCETGKSDNGADVEELKDAGTNDSGDVQQN